MKFLNLVLSAAALSVYVGALNTLFSQVHTPISDAYGGHFQYLTIIGVSLSAIHQVGYIVTELTGLRLAVWIQDKLLKVSSALELLISVLYWPIKLTKPTLLLDPSININIDSSLDRKLHLFPAVAQSVFAIFFSPRSWKRDGIVEPGILVSSLAALYYLWTSHTASINGWYPYPLLGLLTTPQRLGFFIGAAAFALASQRILQALQRSPRNLV